MGARAAAADIRPDNCHARWYFRSGHGMVGITNYIQTRESRTSTQRDLVVLPCLWCSWSRRDLVHAKTLRQRLVFVNVLYLVRREASSACFKSGALPNKLVASAVLLGVW